MQAPARRVGLFFGSFNPVHIGHLIIANFMATRTDLEEVWFVVSPHNPLKPKQSLARDHDRLHLVRLAIDDNDKLRASDIEFGLPKPSYTIDTLAYLKEKHPQHQFCLIMGGDNLATFPKWKHHDLILKDYPIYVYDRPQAAPGDLSDHPQVHCYDAPQIHLSATYVRQAIRDGFSVQYLVPEAVYQYLQTSNLYR